MPTREELEQEFKKYSVIAEASYKATNAANWAMGIEPIYYDVSTPTLLEMQQINKQILPATGKSAEELPAPQSAQDLHTLQGKLHMIAEDIRSTKRRNFIELAALQIEDNKDNSQVLNAVVNSLDTNFEGIPKIKQINNGVKSLIQEKPELTTALQKVTEQIQSIINYKTQLSLEGQDLNDRKDLTTAMSNTSKAAQQAVQLGVHPKALDKMRQETIDKLKKDYVEAIYDHSRGKNGAKERMEYFAKALKENYKIPPLDAIQEVASRKEAHLQHIKANNFSDKQKHTTQLKSELEVLPTFSRYQQLLKDQKSAYELKGHLVDPKNQVARQEARAELQKATQKVMAMKKTLRKEFSVGRHELNQMRKQHGMPMRWHEKAGAKVTSLAHKMATAMRNKFSKQSKKPRGTQRGAGGRERTQASGMGR